MAINREDANREKGMDWQKLLNRERPRKSTLGEDHRQDFERDFDRAVFSTPVKRLQDKAQVFPLDPCDAVRTRLTHSLEVSSVARGLGTAIGRWLCEKKAVRPGQDRAIEAIAATCGLIHDLGNPPFGHAGEDAIRLWFQTRFEPQEFTKLLDSRPQLFNDFLQFEGNAQSLRLVGKLQILADFHGLNLTFGTLSASCKYTARSDEADQNSPNHAKRKPGHFASENDLVERIREATGTGDHRNPLTFLVEAADDIVYSVADVEDGVKKGILTWKDVEDTLSTEMGGAPDILKHVLDRKYTILKAGRACVPKDLDGNAHMAAFRTAAIKALVDYAADTFKQQYDDIMNCSFHSNLVSREGQLHPLVDALKLIGRERIYCTSSTLKLELMGKKVIGDLMDIFWDGAKKLPIDKPPKTKDFPGKAGALLSDNYRSVFQHFASTNKDLPESYHRLQLVTDYVCGMTDSFAKRLHAELMNGT
jgi:dGTPase